MVTLCENTRSRSTLIQLQKRRSLGKKNGLFSVEKPKPVVYDENSNFRPVALIAQNTTITIFF